MNQRSARGVLNLLLVVVFLGAVLMVAGPRTAQAGFTWFDTAYDISISTTGEQVNIDLSSYVPLGATGAIVEIVNTSSNEYHGYVKGSEDPQSYQGTSAYNEIQGESHRYQIVKINVDREIKGEIDNTAVDFKLLGYTDGSDPEYFSDPEKLYPTYGSWQTLDVSSYVDPNADGVILWLWSFKSKDQEWAVRETGSSFSDTGKEFEEYSNSLWVVGLNEDKEFDYYWQSSGAGRIVLIGQTFGSVVHYWNDIPVNDPSTGSWRGIDADTYMVPGEANGLFLYVSNTNTGTDYKGGLRHGDSSDNWNADIEMDTHLMAGVGLNDSGNIWDEYMENTALDFYISAYTIPTPPPTDPAPSITQVNPSSGSAYGGTSVTITGTDFQDGATVTFGGVPLSDTNVSSSTTITGYAPAHVQGAVDVVVTNPDWQSDTLTSGFTYSAPDTGPWHFFYTACDISLNSTATWRTIDLSNCVAAGATGAIVEIVNSTTASAGGMVRGGDDTTDYMPSPVLQGEVQAEAHRYQFVKINSNREIQGIITATNIDFKLIGYTDGDDPVYFTTPYDVSPSAGSWQTVDVTSYVPAAADGVILWVFQDAYFDYNYAIREKGSSYSTTTLKVEEYGNALWVVGIDSNDQFDAYIMSSGVTIYLMGYTSGSVVYYTDDTEVTDPSTGSWQQVDADDYSVNDEANGLFLRMEGGSYSAKAGLRRVGGTDDWNADVTAASHMMGIVGLDGSNRWNEYWENSYPAAHIAAYTRVPPNPPDHYAISHDGTAVNCQAENVTITAHDAGHSVFTAVTGTMVLSTDTGNGDWSLVSGSGTLNNSGDGDATYTWHSSDAGVVVLGLKDTYTEMVNIDVIQDTGSEVAVEDASEDDDLVYGPTGFIFLANGEKDRLWNDIAGKQNDEGYDPRTYELQAVRTDDETGACEAALVGETTVEFGAMCLNPLNCSSAPLVVNGTEVECTDGGGSVIYTPITFDFGDSSDTTATFTIRYDDVQTFWYYARYTLSPSGETIYGRSGGTVWRPFGFYVSVSHNPGASGPSGGVFTTAGDNFTVTVSGLQWEAGDDTNNDGIADGHNDTDRDNNCDLSDNAVAPSYGAEYAGDTEGVLLTATLLQPSGGNNPGLGGTVHIEEFTNGAGTSTDIHFDEVGIILIESEVEDGVWQGIGPGSTARIRGTTSYVGRFKPANFDVSYNTPEFATQCLAGSFTYVGEPFDYTTAPVVTATAKSSRGTTTQNYTSGFMKITNTSLTGRSYDAALGTLDASGLPDTLSDPNIVDNGDGTVDLNFSSGTGLSFQRGDPNAPFDADISLEINVIDADSVAYGSNPAKFGEATVGNGIDFDLDKEMRWGRLVFGNAHGSELVDLSVPLYTEYYDGSAFVQHTADSCTDLSTNDLDMVADPGDLSSTPTIGNSPLSSGVADLSLSSTGGENSGFFDLEFDLSPSGADMTYLQFDWDNDSSHDDNPTARATFGIYEGSGAVIHQRELY